MTTPDTPDRPPAYCPWCHSPYGRGRIVCRHCGRTYDPEVAATLTERPEKRERRPGRSVRTVSGGLPTLGKRRR